MKEGRWLLFIHQLPPKPDYFRVKIWRRLQSLGAIPIKNSVYALPFTDQATEDFQWLRKEITAGGGEASVCRAAFVDGLTDTQIEALFRAARDAEYATVTRAAERPASGGGAEVGRLERRLREITALDHFGALGRKTAEAAVAKLKAHDTTPRGSAKRVRGQTWVTRPDVHVDRIASAWLIKRFIDPKARFVFGEARDGAVSFDMFEGDYTHEGERCTFETLLHRFGLEQDDALRTIAELVHDVDCKDEKFGRDETAGFARLLEGIVKRNARDAARIERGTELLNDLYESVRPSPPARSAQS
ncbi:MAG: chromate resistance protein ChrB domain-containing protein [Gemmatimonadota bacterium]